MSVCYVAATTCQFKSKMFLIVTYYTNTTTLIQKQKSKCRTHIWFRQVRCIKQDTKG